MDVTSVIKREAKHDKVQTASKTSFYYFVTRVRHENALTGSITLSVTSLLPYSLHS